MYPADYCNLTEFFEFPCESISVSCNFDSNTSEIQKILSKCSSQQGTYLKFRHGQPMSGWPVPAPAAPERVAIKTSFDVLWKALSFFSDIKKSSSVKVS